MNLPIQPLTAEAYAAYGDVIAASARAEPGKPANYGTARRFDRLASLENLRATATANVSVFRSAARTDFPFRLALLEKHPGSTQVFIPMTARRYLVVVALGDAAPDLETLRVFSATGSQGISYRPGVWHHPLFNLDEEADFTCLVFEDDTAGDCVEYALPAAGAGAELLLSPP